MQNFLRLIKDALKLDVYDINYSYTPINLQHYLLTQAGLPAKGILVRIIAFFWHMLISFWRILFNRNLLYTDKETVLFFATSQNQQHALHPIMNNMENTSFVGMSGYGEKKFPLFSAYFLSLFFFPLVVYKYFTAPKELRQSYTYAFDLYWFVYGFYIMARLQFQRNHPRTLVLSNDHIMWTRALIFAARAENIPSFYIQHASVTERFPALAFDYALLEGLDSLEKYAAIGKSETKVFLVGMSRFDKFFAKINTNKQIQSVGICTNLFETPELVQPLLDGLHSELNELEFILRPHPRDPRIAEWRAVIDDYGWHFSDSRTENTFDFLDRVDTIMAGESNILLEAALLNVFPIYYDFPAKQMDWYGFYRHGLVPYFAEPLPAIECLADLRQHKPDIRNKAQRYCATVNSSYDGRSTQLTCDVINNMLNQTTQPLENWTPVETGGQLEAYRLKA